MEGCRLPEPGTGTILVAKAAGVWRAIRTTILCRAACRYARDGGRYLASDAIRAGSGSFFFFVEGGGGCCCRCFLFRICGGDIEGTGSVVFLPRYQSSPACPFLGLDGWSGASVVVLVLAVSSERRWLDTNRFTLPPSSPSSQRLVHPIDVRPRCFPPAPSPALLHCTTISKQGVCLSPSPLATFTITVMYVHARSDGTPPIGSDRPRMPAAADNPPAARFGGDEGGVVLLLLYAGQGQGRFRGR